MDENLSLISILRNNTDLGQRFLKAVEEVKEDKEKLLGAAKSYTKKYEKEILEGTKKRQKLISEGKSKGYTEDEILSTTSFLPSVQTPILNFLFFMFRDEADNEQEKLTELTQKYISEFGYEQLTKVLMSEIDQEKDEDTELKDILSEYVNEPKDMTSYLYENITYDIFIKIKKLKALSKSPNEKEAFLAFRKCNELCKKHNLDFVKIPCNL